MMQIAQCWLDHNRLRVCELALIAFKCIRIAAGPELSFRPCWRLSGLCFVLQDLRQLLRAACARLGLTGQGQVCLLLHDRLITERSV